MTTATLDRPAQHAISPEQLAPPSVVRSLMGRWGVGGAIGLVAVIAAFFLSSGGDFLAHQKFFRAYLFGFMVTLGLTLGSMVLLFVQHITGGKWGLVIRRILEAGSRNLWISALFFVPLAFGLKYLYPWMPGFEGELSTGAKHAIAFRQPYMTETWFLVRTAFYFLGWAGFTFFANLWSLRQDRPFDSFDEQNRLRLRFMRLGAAGTLFYCVTITLASVDWIMSLDAVWFSTIWGMIYMVGQTLQALAFTIVILVLLAKYEPMRGFLRKSELHDNGKLLLAFVMLFTYLSFSQFIIIWSGNLMEEIPWYINRIRGGWKPVIITIFLIHFVIPFLLLLNRGLKKHGPKLAAVGMLLMVARATDLFYHIYPNFQDESVLTGGHLNVNWMDVAVPAGMFCVWVALFFWQLTKRPLVPAYHHLVPEVMERAHGAH